MLQKLLVDGEYFVNAQNGVSRAEIVRWRVQIGPADGLEARHDEISCLE